MGFPAPCSRDVVIRPVCSPHDKLQLQMRPLRRVGADKITSCQT